MSKKTKTAKKHRFKHATVAPAVGAPLANAVSADTAVKAETSKPAAKLTPAVVADATLGHDFSYVRRDIRRLSGLVVGLVAVELLLWWVLGNTALGTTVFNAVKL